MSPFGQRVGQLLGAHLRQLRLEAELTQETVATAMGTHRPIVCRIERGMHCQSLETVEAYARVLGLELLDVLVVLDVHQAELEQLLGAT